MRINFPLFCFAAVFLSGCANQPQFSNPTGFGSPAIITPAHDISGRVTMVNPAKNVVVLNFPIGQLPELNQPMTAYRHGKIVGEILITGPRRDDNIAGEIFTGEIQVGDEVRSR